MTNKFVISLSSVSRKIIPYRYFKEQAESLLHSTLEEWKDDPKEILDKKIPELKDYDFYFTRLHNFRKRMTVSLKKNCIFEYTKIDEESVKYMLIFDIDSILQDIYNEQLHYNSNRLNDVLMIVSELTTKLKSNNYIRNMEFLFENDSKTLPEEMKDWTELLRTLKSETFYLIDEDDEL